MIKLVVLLVLCRTAIAAGLHPKHVQSQKAPCLLQIPCIQGARETIAENCNRYRQCVGPSEWTEVLCPATEIFSNVTGECNGVQCSEWTCEIRYTDPLQDPVPCLTPGLQCEEGKTIPDRYYCTWYYKCVDQVWGRIQCPIGQYFSVGLSELDEEVPCSESIGVCDNIDFSVCLGGEGPLPADDACNPAVPCTLGQTISDPSSCWRYQVCVAPYEWAVSDHECGGNWGPYNNLTGKCDPGNTCLPTWECPIVQPTPQPISPRPCVEDETVPCSGDPEYIPDSYYCSWYHECILNQWVARECPAGEYFSLNLASIGADPPCTGDETHCKEIPFEQCTETSYPGDQDPCDPTLPCTQGDKINYPGQCNQYQQCTGPYEWSIIGCPAGEQFSNVTGECHAMTVCEPWTCGPGSTQPSKDPMPCLLTNSTTCTDLTTVPDSYHCTSYFKCVAGTWVLLTCPIDTPFYSTERAAADAIIPCSPFPSICDRIPYESCRNTTTAPSNGCTPPVPCVPKSEASYPPQCTQYQVCVAPYQWDVITCVDGNYNNITDDCDPGYTCHTWPCDTSQPPTPAPVPCTPDQPCTNGNTAPDKYTCTSYFKCVDGDWVELSCPVDAPYFSMPLSQAGAIVPCVKDPTHCYEIPFEFCNSTIPEGPDACTPPVPCQPGQRISYPQDPERYQECVAPYQWVESGVECGGVFGCFDNVTQTCRPENPCEPWSCGGGGPDPPTTAPEPCFTEIIVMCTDLELGDTVPSRYHCSLYFKCDGNEWVELVCPVDEPYYSTDLASLNAPIPCVDEITHCYEIPYEECLDPVAGFHLDADPPVGANVDDEIELADSSVRAAGPCLPVRDYECKEGRAVPDRLGCMTYYECTGGLWVQRECPPYTPYYDVDLANKASAVPCTNDLTKCDVIPFHACEESAPRN